MFMRKWTSNYIVKR